MQLLLIFSRKVLNNTPGVKTTVNHDAINIYQGLMPGICLCWQNLKYIFFFLYLSCVTTSILQTEVVFATKFEVQ